jgi:hypothetical protein
LGGMIVFVDHRKVDSCGTEHNMCSKMGVHQEREAGADSWRKS